MRRALVLPTVLLGGCCCCGFGGGGGSSSGGFGDRVGDAIGEKVQEAAVERMYEAGTGHDLDITSGGQRFTAETDEGTMTTTIDGSVPEGFAWTLPAGAKVTLATRIDPKDPADGGPTWSVSYETTDDWRAVAAHWTAEGAQRGYKVTSTNAAMKEAFAAVAAEGVTIGAPDVALENGDMIAFESDDPNKVGSAIVDGSQPGKTTVLLTVR